jgi:hypothetical protein
VGHYLFWIAYIANNIALKLFFLLTTQIPTMKEVR